LKTAKEFISENEHYYMELDPEQVLYDAMEEYAELRISQSSSENLSPKDAIDFANYVLSPLRVQDIMKHPLFQGVDKEAIKARLSFVRDVDWLTFQNHKKEN